jgi:L-ascorbate metabolism protein UlaG (beta-lactamase superfamily)
MKLVYHGHSFVEILFQKQSILINPFIHGNSGCDVSFDDVIAKNIQAIVVTHGHDDHLGETIELAQVSGAVVITSYELGEYLMREK